MFTISVETRFSASHQLIFPDGSQEPLHGHDWQVVAAASSSELDGMGVVMDFHQLKGFVDEILSGFNGCCLNEFDCFRSNGTSAENVAKYIYEELAVKLCPSVNLCSISVMEESGCVAKFVK